MEITQKNIARDLLSRMNSILLSCQKNKIKLLLVSSIIFAITFLYVNKDLTIFHSVPTSSKKVVKKEQPISGNELIKQLNDIASKLTSIESHVKNDPMLYMEKVHKDLGDITNQAQTLANQSGQIITNQIQQSTADLVGRLSDINTKLEKLEAERQKAVYLKSEDLPFKVQHIDNIQQQDIVTVYYNQMSVPLNIGDYLGDWKLISADFASQKAEFINSEKQHIVIDLNHVQLRESE